MGLKNADLCTRCGERRTRHPSGLCCRCRMAAPAGTCKICGGQTKRNNDFCYKCRKSLATTEDLDSAIREQQKKLMILILRKQGMSFGQIAEAVGISKSQVFAVYKEMMRLPYDMPPEIADSLLEQEPEDD